jgi:hypothetical protein
MKDYFKRGRLHVTTQFVKARNRSIDLGTVETVEVSRPLFVMGLGLCGGMVVFGLAYGDLLYLGETIAAVTIGAAVLAAAYQIGTLTVFSKLTQRQGFAILGWHKTLRDMRAAIETALEDRRQPQA